MKLRALISQFSCTDVMMNMKLLAVVTPPCIYHGCSTWKMFWEKKFTGKGKFFLAVNMKNCGRRNVRIRMDIKGSENYVTLHIPLKYGSLDKMEITSSDPEEKLERSGKWLITSLVF